jgi:hypothetical protein
VLCLDRSRVALKWPPALAGQGFVERRTAARNLEFDQMGLAVIAGVKSEDAHSCAGS